MIYLKDLPNERTDVIREVTLDLSDELCRELKETPPGKLTPMHFFKQLLFIDYCREWGKRVPLTPCDTKIPPTS